MARALSLGPLVVPCPVEMSTAHGKAFFWAAVFPTIKDNPAWISVSASDHAYRSLRTNLWSQISFASPVSRHGHALSVQCSAPGKLGFWLKGLVPKIGPVLSLRSKPIICYPSKLGFSLKGLASKIGPSLRPKPTNSDPAPNDNKPRYVLSSSLSIPSQYLGRSFDFNGRRHHLREKASLLLWIYNHILQTLDLVSNMAMIYETKMYGLLFLNQNRRRLNCGHVSMPNYDSKTTLSTDLKHRPIAIIPKVRIMCYPLPCSLKQTSSEYITIFNRSLAADILEPARITSLASSSTSSSLLTVTILSSMDSFVENRSTNRDLTCGKTFDSLCLKALMELSSIYFIYPFVALGNAFYVMFQTLGSLNPLISLYLVYFE